MNNFFSRLASFRKQKAKAKKASLSERAEAAVPRGHFFMRLSLRSQISFIKQLAVLMRGGVPLFSSLGMLKKQSRTKTMKKIMGHVIADVENGQYLGTALGKFKKIFGELTVNIIAIGEISGTLSDNLDHLAASLKKKQSLQRKIISASVYPVFIIVATIGITIMLTVFIFPKIIPVFKSVNYRLPWTTRFLMWLNEVLTSYGIYIGLGAIVLIVVVCLLLRIEKIRYWLDIILIKIPVSRKFIQMYNTANMCRTVGLLLNSGVGVVRAFHITANTTANLAYKRELTAIADRLVKGEIISDSMYKNPRLFPIMASQMITVGESTGKLSETFMYLADTYEEEMDELAKNLSATVEPLLLIFMGILVGFIAISIITPIYGITQRLTPR